MMLTKSITLSYKVILRKQKYGGTYGWNMPTLCPAAEWQKAVLFLESRLKEDKMCKMLVRY